MNKQTFRFEVLMAPGLLTHTCQWKADCDGPRACVEMSKQSRLLLTPGSIGKFEIEGDLEIFSNPAMHPTVELRWKQGTIEDGRGQATVTVSHASSEYKEMRISVWMKNPDSLSIHEDLPLERAPSPPDRRLLLKCHGDFLCAYPAMVIALIFAVLIPSERYGLIIGAAVIGLVGTVHNKNNARTFGAVSPLPWQPGLCC